MVTGCYAQRAPDEIAQLPGVSLVAGNSHKTEIAELLSTPTMAIFTWAISFRRTSF